MGMYTELHYNVELVRDVPEEVIEVLTHMVSGRSKIVKGLEHPFFSCARWDWMLNSDSYYFNSDTISTLRYDAIGECWYLNIKCNFKNYTGELKEFLAWIDPYVQAQTGEFLGFSRYEEENEPMLVYKGRL